VCSPARGGVVALVVVTWFCWSAVVGFCAFESSEEREGALDWLGVLGLELTESDGETDEEIGMGVEAPVPR
jgi:hypothetical protein